MRRATTYLRKGTYIVHASSMTTDGVWIRWEPTLAVSEGAGVGELGQAIVAALDGSCSGVPHPRDWNAVLHPLLALIGVKSWATFSKSATCLEVEEEAGRVVLVPTRNLGKNGGFEMVSANQVFTTRGDLTRMGTLAAELLR